MTSAVSFHLWKKNVTTAGVAGNGDNRCTGTFKVPIADKYKVTVPSTCTNLAAGATCKPVCKVAGSKVTGTITCDRTKLTYSYVAPKGCPITCDTLKIDGTKWTNGCKNIAMGKTCKVTCKSTSSTATYICTTARAYKISGTLPRC